MHSQVAERCRLLRTVEEESSRPLTPADEAPASPLLALRHEHDVIDALGHPEQSDGLKEDAFWKAVTEIIQREE